MYRDRPKIPAFETTEVYRKAIDAARELAAETDPEKRRKLSESIDLRAGFWVRGPDGRRRIRWPDAVFAASGLPAGHWAGPWPGDDRASQDE